MKNITIYTIGIVLAAASFLLDKAALNFFKLINNDFVTALMSVVTVLGSSLAVVILTTLIFMFSKKNRKYLSVLWITLIIGYLLTSLLKTLTARERPESLLIEETGFSFPSGHSVAVFAPFIIIKKHFPKLKLYWIILAAIVLFSRLYLGAHYLSDVIAGALIGYLVGDLVIMASDKLKISKFLKF